MKISLQLGEKLVLTFIGLSLINKHPLHFQLRLDDFGYAQPRTTAPQRGASTFGITYLFGFNSPANQQASFKILWYYGYANQVFSQFL